MTSKAMLHLRAYKKEYQRKWSSDPDFRFQAILLSLMLVGFPLLTCLGLLTFTVTKGWELLFLAYVGSIACTLALFVVIILGAVSLDLYDNLRPSKADERQAAKASAAQQRAELAEEKAVAHKNRLAEAEDSFVAAADELYSLMGVNTLSASVAAHDLLARIQKEGVIPPLKRQRLGSKHG